MFTDLMWDNAGRDMEGERAELARTAALQDVERDVWPLLSQARDEVSLGHFIALASAQLERVEAVRGYPARSLAEDLTRRWRLLAEARAAGVPPVVTQPSSGPAVEEGERLLAVTVGRMAATAAAENPHLSMEACLRLAEEAALRHLVSEAGVGVREADAYPLAYQSWQHVVNGPLMQRLKSWRPKGRPAGGQPSAPAVTPAAAPSATPSSGGGGASAAAPGSVDDWADRMDARLDHAHQQFQGEHEKQVAQAPTFDERADHMDARLDVLQHSLRGENERHDNMAGSTGPQFSHAPVPQQQSSAPVGGSTTPSFSHTPAGQPSARPSGAPAAVHFNDGTSANRPGAAPQHVQDSLF